MALDLEEMLTDTSRLWVFGYGSILWKTGFEYNSKLIGHIGGFERRFWQGNTTHRGTVELPGRVATLVASADSEAKVWGVAFELVGARMIRAALEHLGVRECALGGYCHVTVPFHPKNCSNRCSFSVLLFTATEENNLYLGPAPLEEVAQQVIECKGKAGHNVEYVLRLAEFVRAHLTDDNDDHLFGLESLIHEELRRRNICPERLIREHIQAHHVYRKRKEPETHGMIKIAS
ncbi:hypothetical protein CAPTEDRAFT_168933 [Capitella teleta]|uniref:glutathione-specific gamma-glutamylcyclotransferase n=1 Tax=Capitella teleta TaxID=283909 RepID=R7UDS2_CAPTE|nr:hypothetical protein CAPTEDRAFT_168933 [Capitella teleta]|eukprot:ELU04540.1 hypothetical protein CAPTEDRAFT_168933 [Capitella teleta]